jgi:hypothetical protein
MTVTGGTGTGATFTPNFGVQPTITITNAGSGYVEQPTVTFSGGGGSGAAAYATVGSGTTVKSIGSTMSFFTPNGEGFRVVDTGDTSTQYWQARGGTQAILRSTGQAFIQSTGGNAINLATNAGTNQLVVAHTASAVNFVQVTGSPTSPTGLTTSNITFTGSDSVVNGVLVSKGSGGYIGFAGSSPNAHALRVFMGNASASGNLIQIQGAAAGSAPSIQAISGFGGADANIPLVLQPKGTGALQAQLNDGTATGGNARGANAVDWQTVRGAASQVASGIVSFIGGGQNNISSSYGTVVCGGANSSATGANTFVGGGTALTVNGAYAAAVGGAFNTAAGSFNFIGGGANNSGTALAAVTTQSATMNATTAVTLSGSNANIKVGQYISGTSIGFGTYVAAISGTSLTLSQAATGSSTSTLSFFTPHGVVVGGGNNQATGAYSFIGGGGDAGTASLRNAASGDWSFVGGGSQNTASGSFSSVLGGGNCSATGSFAVNLGGAGNASSGFGSTNLGGNGNIANGTYSVAGGFSSANRSIGSFAFASGSASRNGDAQAVLFVLRNATTDATPTVLTIGAGAAGTTNQVILPNNAAYHFRGSVIANVTGAANGAAWSFEGAIMRGANAASTVLIGAPVVNRIAASAGATAWTIAVTADTTNGGLAVTVTGAASTTIRWVAKLETTEVTF